MSKSLILKDLLDHQLKNIHPKMKLQYNDLKRIAKYIECNIFSIDKCCLWNGYVTNENKVHKGTYINFYFKKKKMALHRLLYVNYIGELTDNEYLKFNCEHRGRCCSIHHMKKYNYQRSPTEKETLELENTNESGLHDNINDDINDVIALDFD